MAQFAQSGLGARIRPALSPAPALGCSKIPAFFASTVTVQVISLSED